MAFKVSCPVCGKTFEAKSPRARYDTEACRKKASRERAAGAKIPKPKLTLVDLTERLPDTKTPATAEPFTVGILLRAALDEIPDTSPLTTYRKAHALTLAAVLDDPSKPNLYRGITTALHEVLTHLVAATPEANKLADIVAAIRGT